MSKLGITAPPPEKHNLCQSCTGRVEFVSHGCLMRHCPMCNGPMAFSTQMCLKCSSDKNLCQGCGKSCTADATAGGAVVNLLVQNDTPPSQP